jgi:hypothetical protein
MTPPPYGRQPYGRPAPAGDDRTTLWGVLGIVLSVCCWPLGVVFAILSLLDARKAGRAPTLAYVAFGIVALRFIVDALAIVNGWYDFTLSTTAP